MYRYLFLCRVHPKSGMDLAKYNKALNLLDKMLKDNLDYSSESSSEVLNSWNSYKEETDGFVLETVSIVSDNVIIDPEVEVMPEIRATYPEAEMIRYLMVPDGLNNSDMVKKLALLS